MEYSHYIKPINVRKNVIHFRIRVLWTAPHSAAAKQMDCCYGLAAKEHTLLQSLWYNDYCELTFAKAAEVAT